MADDGRDRAPAGSGERGGQFIAARAHAEPGFELDAGTDTELELGTDSVVEAMVSGDDVEDRAAASTDLRVTVGQLRRLADPATQPVLVRWSVSCLPYDGVADRASRDPDPVVRACALAGSGLSAPNQRRLERDPEVALATARLTA